MNGCCENSVSLIVSDSCDLSQAYKLLKDDGTLWLYVKREDTERMFKEIEEAGFENHLENWLVVDTNGKRKDYVHLTKSKKYVWHSLETLREVTVPYTVAGKDGQRVKRGWDYLDGKPMRWTGLGNVIYDSTGKLYIAALILSSSNVGDIVRCYDNDLAVTLERKACGQKDEELFKLIESRLSTSEDESSFSKKKRKFLPQV